MILSGGAGARLGGQDKGLSALSGRPLIEHVLDRMRPQCSRVLVVANRNLDRYAAYAPTIHDEATGHAGPLAGLVAAFGFLAANLHALPRWLLTVSVDCPDAPGDLAARLHAVASARGDVRCAYVRVAGQPQPLFALYRIGDDPLAWRQSAQAALRKHGSPRRWHAGLDAPAVDFDGADGAFHNLNTPDDFRNYERTHG